MLPPFLHSVLSSFLRTSVVQFLVPFFAHFPWALTLFASLLSFLQTTLAISVLLILECRLHFCPRPYRARFFLTTPPPQCPVPSSSFSCRHDDGVFFFFKPFSGREISLAHLSILVSMQPPVLWPASSSRRQFTGQIKTFRRAEDHLFFSPFVFFFFFFCWATERNVMH